ncbi:LysR family transcriptional regulator [Glutamicibacter sp.]|uniref:LysR family transcriptional regulator n=1 Tax=Glutamicibacter sp. TaxID=1931995 RepID=UPI0028BE308B|nr:LysR family transcriptional regulator [Glutamicibacter sp.]
MNLEQLRGFTTIARMGHFTRAAEELHLAQPSLSRQIATLEHDLGSVLFQRARGNITLTPAGRALLPLATRMLADEESIRVEMAELAGLRRGRVRLGAPPTLCVSLVAEVLSSFHAKYPGIELQISEAGSRVLLEQLSGGQLDLALIVTSEHAVNETTLQHVPLLAERLVVADAPDGALSKQDTVDLRALAKVPQIAFSRSYDLRAATMSAYDGLGLDPNIVIDGGEMDAVLRFVQAGLGVAVVPATVLTQSTGLRSVQLVDPQLQRTIGLEHRRDVTLTTAVAAMQEMIRSTAQQLAGRFEPISTLS